MELNRSKCSVKNESINSKCSKQSEHPLSTKLHNRHII